MSFTEWKVSDICQEEGVHHIKYLYGFKLGIIYLTCILYLVFFSLYMYVPIMMCTIKRIWYVKASICLSIYYYIHDSGKIEIIKKTMKITSKSFLFFWKTNLLMQCLLFALPEIHVLFLHFHNLQFVVFYVVGTERESNLKSTE